MAAATSGCLEAVQAVRLCSTIYGSMTGPTGCGLAGQIQRIKQAIKAPKGLPMPTIYRGQGLGVFPGPTATTTSGCLGARAMIAQAVLAISAIYGNMTVTTGRGSVGQIR